MTETRRTEMIFCIEMDILRGKLSECTVKRDHMTISCDQIKKILENQVFTLESNMNLQNKKLDAIPSVYLDMK